MGERVGVTGPALPALEIIYKQPQPSSLLSYFQRQHPAPGTHTRITVCALLPPAGHTELILSRAQGNAICKFQLLFNSLPPIRPPAIALSPEDSVRRQSIWANGQTSLMMQLVGFLLLWPQWPSISVAHRKQWKIWNTPSCCSKDRFMKIFCWIKINSSPSGFSSQRIQGQPKCQPAPPSLRLIFIYDASLLVERLLHPWKPTHLKYL